MARDHAGRGGLEIDYRQGVAEDLTGEGRSFDAVLSLEVVEHVADVGDSVGYFRVRPTAEVRDVAGGISCGIYFSGSPALRRRSR